MKRTRVRWRRLAVIALGASLAVDLVAFRASGSTAEHAASQIYVVRSGDTIWGIARREAGPREDPRPLVDRLIRVNHIRDALISPGQRLVLPS
jgi:nucleoid-associated protein YgaU